MACFVPGCMTTMVLRHFDLYGAHDSEQLPSVIQDVNFLRAKNTTVVRGT